MNYPNQNISHNSPSKIKADDVDTKKAVELNQLEKHANNNQNDGHVQASHPTSYGETLMHLLRGNIGAGMYGMGDAYKNGGIILSPILTVFIASMAVHNQHILVDRCHKMRELQEKSNSNGNFDNPDFAETVELCFANGPPGIRPWSKFVKFIVNVLICITQLGFCCIYFVFIAESFQQIWKIYVTYEWDGFVRIFVILIPIMLISLITDLKYLAPVSTIANVSMGAGLALTLYYAFSGLPDIRERRFVGDIDHLPLFLGTTIFSFEGIALVLPLRNIMKKPKLFARPAGVLNIGMVVVSTLLAFCGFFGYWKWGEETKGSLTLNLPEKEPLAQTVKLMVAIGILLTYPLQFFVAIQIMWSSFLDKFGPLKYPIGSELLFRIFFVLFTYIISEMVPLLNLFISLIGSMCSTSLALLIPPLIDLVSKWGLSDGPTPVTIVKNICVILFGTFCFITGTYESVGALINGMMHREHH